jgi:decaprenylphospho-beta-D-ribofuranose 2-oxidase
MADDETLLSGWGRSTWSRASRSRPGDIEDLRAEASGAGERGAIVRGLGRSYGDQATNAGGLVIETAGLADSSVIVASDGRVTVSGGTSIDDLLRMVVPQGWFLPVVPGTRFVSIGGAIANDIHGKNHHVDGSMGVHVDEIELFLADGTVTPCGPDIQPDLFWATVGGMGLTGVIVTATLRLLPITSSRVLVDTDRLGSLDALIDAMTAADLTAKYSVAWIDLVARGKRTGRSILTTGDFAPAADVDDEPLGYDPRQPLRAPGLVPSGLLRRPTVRAFNGAWFRRSPRHRVNELQTISRFFHPLDGVDKWNRLYGRDGLMQWQMVVPDGAEDTLREAVTTISSSAAPSFLAVLKRLGDANLAPMSFPLRGWTLAADFPAGHRALVPLLDQLDHRVAAAGGRVYLAKDGRLDPRLLAQMYPRLDEWQAIRRSVDPRRRWQSDLSRRLDLDR